MLRSMGWAEVKLYVSSSRFFNMYLPFTISQGKGLGLNEDGQTDHVRIKKKEDNAGNFAEGC